MGFKVGASRGLLSRKAALAAEKGTGNNFDAKNPNDGNENAGEIPSVGKDDKDAADKILQAFFEVHLQNLAAEEKDATIPYYASTPTGEVLEQMQHLLEDTTANLYKKKGILEDIQSSLPEVMHVQQDDSITLDGEQDENMAATQQAKILESYEPFFRSHIKKLETQALEHESLMRQMEINIENRLMKLAKYFETLEAEASHEVKQENDAMVHQLRAEGDMINAKLEEAIKILEKSKRKELHDLSQMLTSKITKYLSDISAKNREYSYLAQVCEKLERSLEQKKIQSESLFKAADLWKSDAMIVAADLEKEKIEFESAKKNIQASFLKLQNRVKNSRHKEESRLLQLLKAAKSCKNTLKDQIKLGEVISRYTQQCRKAEAEIQRARAKFDGNSFACAAEIDENDANASSGTIDILGMKTENSENGETIEWVALDPFFKKYNEALINFIALSKRLSYLEVGRKDGEVDANSQMQNEFFYALHAYPSNHDAEGLDAAAKTIQEAFNIGN